MKKQALALLVALACAPLALADAEEEHFHGTTFQFSIGAGALIGDTLDEGESPVFDAGVDIDESVMVEARFGIRPFDWFEVEGAVSFAPTEFVVDGSTDLFGGTGDVTLADVDIWHYTASANLHFLPARSRFDPFFTLGAGAATYNVDGGVDADTKFAVVVGGGFTYWFSDRVGMRADVRDYVTVLDVQDDYDYSCDCYEDYDTASDTINNFGVLASLALRWD